MQHAPPEEAEDIGVGPNAGEGHRGTSTVFIKERLKVCNIQCKHLEPLWFPLLQCCVISQLEQWHSTKMQFEIS